MLRREIFLKVICGKVKNESIEYYKMFKLRAKRRLNTFNVHLYFYTISFDGFKIVLFSI